MRRIPRTIAMVLTAGLSALPAFARAPQAREAAAPMSGGLVVAYAAEHSGPAGQDQKAPEPPARAQGPSGLPEGAGRDVLLRKCFQCHNQGMWRDLRGDRRVWEGVVYRMVGRGALWTEEEIASMVAYLAQAAGAGSQPRR